MSSIKKSNLISFSYTGDIDIVGAIGDSLTAGNGAFALNIVQIIIENKGVSWSIGGQVNIN